MYIIIRGKLDVNDKKAYFIGYPLKIISVRRRIVQRFVITIYELLEQKGLIKNNCEH